MRMKYCSTQIEVVLLCIFLLSGCSFQDKGELLMSVKMQETEMTESRYGETSEEEDRIRDKHDTEETQKILTEENHAEEKRVEKDHVMEIYADGEKISISEDDMIAKVSPLEILKGVPVLYNRFWIDGWFFEWLISDYHDKDNQFLEDGVLVASCEEDNGDVQVIHIKAKGGGGVKAQVEYKFEYVDVNFDGLPDLLIRTGYHGNQGLSTYYCFLQTENGFEEVPSFTGIPNPSVDAENKLILSYWRNSASSHSWAEFKFQDNAYDMHRELCEYYEEGNEDEYVAVWTVNGEEIARSDECSREEIRYLFYNENSEWRKSRWHKKLTTDYSLYDTP